MIQIFNYTPPTDEDIKDIFSKWEQKNKIWKDIGRPDPLYGADIVAIDWEPEKIILPQNGILGDFLLSMHKLINHMVYVPVIWSGKYRFKIGQHQNGISIHGQPYVLRLQGTGDEYKPYNAKNIIKEKDLLKIEGNWISTINKNRNQKMNYITEGINIHRGRRSRDYKDSEGCLTIHPDDWGCFIRIFPCIKEWNNQGHEGIVEVIRLKQRPRSSPAKPCAPKL